MTSDTSSVRSAAEKMCSVLSRGPLEARAIMRGASGRSRIPLGRHPYGRPALHLRQAQGDEFPRMLVAADRQHHVLLTLVNVRDRRAGRAGLELRFPERPTGRLVERAELP